MQIQEEQQPTSTNVLLPLQQKVAQSVTGYFSQLGNNSSINLYDIFLAEIEEPLLKAVIEFTNGNQSKAAMILGISRGTLRKKLKLYDLIDTINE